MSCCDDIIMRMCPDAVPGAFTAELSDGSLISFDRDYLRHAGDDTTELLQAGLVPRSMMDDWRRLLRRRRPGERPVLTWPLP